MYKVLKAFSRFRVVMVMSCCYACSLDFICNFSLLLGGEMTRLIPNWSSFRMLLFSRKLLISLRIMISKILLREFRNDMDL